MPPAVLVDQLVVGYGGPPAVAGLSLVAPRGQVTALVGPNGAGKTTTVEVCLGLRSPDSGRVEVLGAAPGLRRDAVGAMLQDGGLYTTARPGELVRYAASLYRDPEDPDQLLSRLGIDPASRTTVRRLSGGEQQRLKCALALVGRPELVFLDEPTAGLDAVARRDFHDIVRSLVAEGTSVVLTTHLMDDVERLADHVVVVAHGAVVAHGTVPELVGTDDRVAFDGPMHMDTAALAAALPASTTISELRAGHYVVTGAEDPMTLSIVAAWCAQHGVRTQDLHVGRRSLEDVVVELVGDL